MGTFHIEHKDFKGSVPNHVTQEGIELMLKAVFQGDNFNGFTIGLTGNKSDVETLAAVTLEPLSSEGYARQAVSRNVSGWPTLDKRTGVVEVTSKAVTFRPRVNFSQKVIRAFLASDSGKLIAMSQPFPTELDVTIQNPLTIHYSFDGG